MALHLASGWFGGRPNLAGAQVREAADWRFPALALLSDDPPVRMDGFEAARRDTDLSFSAADWTSLQGGLAAAGPEPATLDREGFEAVTARIPAVLTALSALGASRLLVRPGLDASSGVRERSDRLIGRLRAGEITTDGDEAVEEIRAQCRSGEALALRGRQLEGLARFLHALRTAAPGLIVALVPGVSPAEILDPESMLHLLEDGSLGGLGLWLDVPALQGRQQMGVDTLGSWLDRFGPRIQGATLADYHGGRDGLPPGDGEVDWPLVTEYVPREVPKVLALAPSYPVEPMLEARDAFEGMGLR